MDGYYSRLVSCSRTVLVEEFKMIAPLIEYGLLLVLLLSGVPLLISTGVSLIGALIQAATQIQEQSIGFLLKVISLGCVIAVGGTVIIDTLREYLIWSYHSIRYLGG